MITLTQYPSPGSFHVRYRGDTLTIVLTLSAAFDGTAFLRTNCGFASIRREEKIAEVQHDTPVLDKDWHDVQMQQKSDTRYEVTLVLDDAGFFEGKAFFVSRKARELWWPDGDNISIKVHPATIYACNTTYCAFVRQFGPYMGYEYSSNSIPSYSKKLEKQGYNIIPPSGTFRALIRNLDFIIKEMGFRIIQLLPIHPVPTTYARMGTFGSPYATRDFFDVDPSMAEFDKKTTPLDQFCELVDAVHAREGLLLIDLPVNHTGWASKLHNMHPEWFVKSGDDTFTSPGAWGVVWGDLLQLDFRHKKLWEYLAQIFLFWCRHGVDGFRCDAGYMLPLDTWQYIIMKVRKEYPDTVFFLEGLGGDPRVTERLLTEADMNWAYSELFQNYSREQIESYTKEALPLSFKKGPLLHYSETHDNNRLASTSHTFARMRTALCALLSDSGAFGITNGVEWYAPEKIDVHKACGLNWGSKDNMVDYITRINNLIYMHPAFLPDTDITFVHTGDDNSIAVLRTSPNGHDTLLVLVNLDHEHSRYVQWQSESFDPSEDCRDYLSDGIPAFKRIAGDRIRVRLERGQVCCITNAPSLLPPESGINKTGYDMPYRWQMCRAKASKLISFYKANAWVGANEPDEIAHALVRDPSACIRNLAGYSQYTPIIRWNYPEDIRRWVVLPCNHVLYIQAPCSFRAYFERNGTIIRQETSLRHGDGSAFLIMIPPDETPSTAEIELHLVLYDDTQIQHICSHLFLSPPSSRVRLMTRCDKKRLSLDSQVHALCVNKTASAAQVRGAWSEIQSKYDSFLSANLHSRYPVDRTVVWTRCRIWLRYRGYSFILDRKCQHSFMAGDNNAIWEFHVPCGNGLYVTVTLRLFLDKEKPGSYLIVQREPAHGNNKMLPDEIPVTLIIRPDIDNRDFHTVTKAFAGPEGSWPALIHQHDRSFDFELSDTQSLSMNIPGSSFVREDEWNYMVAMPVDKERGLDDCGDFYSPGYFIVKPGGGDIHVLHAKVHDKLSPAHNLSDEGTDANGLNERNNTVAWSGEEVDRLFHTAIRAFLVKRDKGRTVIAGYPWFLDWGRDTLISLRGIIAAGLYQDAGSIIRTFCEFEYRGTLPNMIRGNDSSNRDTSDAPLWLFVACSDLCAAHSSYDFVHKEQAGERSIREVLVSVANGYMEGTENGIMMDEESGLIFSPSHFTWMDTNFPAATPRQGYPIEIQALWWYTLDFLTKVDGEKWGQLRHRVRESIRRFFPVNHNGREYCADLLVAQPGMAASDAQPDDALRPNQLCAIALGAVDDSGLARNVVDSCYDLVVPGAIRSLADRRVEMPLHVEHDGTPLFDPHYPFHGEYTGNEDTQRKPAYHNGTAWTWLFPMYCEALYRVYGKEAEETARSLLATSAYLLDHGCMGHIPEILDGNYPHIQKGCGAQAWGITELYRVRSLLKR